MENVGIDLAYLYEMQRHPFPHFIELDVLPTIGGHREGRGKGGGRGGGGR